MTTKRATKPAAKPAPEPETQTEPETTTYASAEDWPEPRPLCEACGQPAPTTVDDYLKSYSKCGPKTITLPSGAVFVVDRPAIVYLAVTRRLRPEIAALVLEKGAGLVTGDVGLEPDELMMLVDYFVSLSVIEPPVSFDEGVEGRLWVKRIPEADRRAILDAVELEV
jgi:hypothetical protein